MERIDQVKERKDLAYRVLSWIVYAMRPLTVDELTHALAVEIGRQSLTWIAYAQKITCFLCVLGW
jgi:hypothetical protein